MLTSRPVPMHTRKSEKHLSRTLTKPQKAETSMLSYRESAVSILFSRERYRFLDLFPWDKKPWS